MAAAPDKLRLAVCKTCGEQIAWVTMVTDRAMPVNPKLLHSIQVQDGVGRMVQSYEPHWATCPSAKEHKRPAPAPKPEPAPLLDNIDEIVQATFGVP